MSEYISDVVAMFKELDGFDLSQYEKSFLDSSVHRRMTETLINSQHDYYRLLANNPNERKILFESLTISYSEFFRNPLTYAILERIVLPKIAFNKKKKKEIRIWSAACAGGQEAYSLAILLEELIHKLPYDISYRIFATDRSEREVQEAQKGQFPLAAINKISLKRAEDWFIKQGEIYVVKPQLKEKIDFSVFDLFENAKSCPPFSIFGDFELIVCANLLYYYENEYRKKIVEKTSNCLANRGFLVSDESEREIFMNFGFIEIISPSAIFQKDK